MQLFGFEIRRVGQKSKAATSMVPGAHGRGGWWPIIREPFSGAWQRNRELNADTLAAHHAVYTCVTLIASDIGKLRPKLVQHTENDIWQETHSAAFSPVLRKPNRYQNHIQFKQWWMASKLLRGNVYVLLQRDNRGVVVRQYILDATRVQVLVAEDGSVFYQLSGDNLSGVGESVMVPASEIIHDRMNCLFHPLVGVSPIFAAGMAAQVGLTIEQNAADFFGNSSNPSGILTAPGTIPDPTARRLKDHWERNYSGQNSGRVAVLGDGLSFEQMRMTAVDAQMIEHLKWTAETVCSAFHVPPFKVGIGNMPTYNNAQILNQIYYSDCLQSHIEEFELAQDEGLGLLDSKEGGRQLGVELDLDALLRMDTATQIEALGKGVGAGIFAPNEARAKLDLQPVVGGATPYLQQQNYSLAALDARDRLGPPGSAGPNPPGPPQPPGPEPQDEEERTAELALRIKQRARLLRMSRRSRKVAA